MKAQHKYYQKILSKKRQIKIEPQSTIVFNSCPYSTVGQIKIYTKDLDRYTFQLKTTNKVSYKVSEAKGQINHSPYQILIYLKDLTCIQRRLKDIFKLIIRDKNLKCEEPLNWKFKVMIQEVRNFNSEDTATSTNTDNISKASSLFTTPSIMTSIQVCNRDGSCIRRSAFSKNQIPLANRDFLSPQQASTINKEIVKQKFNNSLQILKQKRGQLDLLIDSQRTIKAKNRFRVYLVVLIFTFCLFSGYIFGKTFPDFYQNIKELVWKEQQKKGWFKF